MKKNQSYYEVYLSPERDETGYSGHGGPVCDSKHAKTVKIRHIVSLSLFPGNLSKFFSDIRTTELVPPTIGAQAL